MLNTYTADQVTGYFMMGTVTVIRLTQILM